jgi:hypothetical protein
MMAYYEGPTAFPPATHLPALARVLGVSVDTRMQRHLQQISNLPPEERCQILQLVDAFIERGQLKRRATQGERTNERLDERAAARA